tara:strand:+ start:14625 stop:15074 length:450 start_codon:yes stop_codon:yes gene_type:complete
MRKLALLLFLLIGGLAQGQTSYFFCVTSEDYETFKAEVEFKSFDFGQSAAKQMLLNDLQNSLSGEIQVSTYNPKTCSCPGNCPEVKIGAKDWDGNFSDNEFSVSGAYGSAVEIADVLISSGQELLNNPGRFLIDRVFGSKKTTAGGNHK